MPKGKKAQRKTEVNTMRINYNVTGTRRKELVKVISDTTGAKAEYKFMPTCNFEIGDLTVTKNGALEWDERTAPETINRITEALTEAGFSPEPDTTAEADATESSEEQEGTAPEAKGTGLTVEIPLDKVAVGNLTNILEAKGSLIKKALGVDDLRFDTKEDRIAFPWFKELPGPDEAKAYTEFISMLCKLSKELKRTSSKETPVANEKYAFRCFLLRLGFIGSEYKASRKILLKNLSGNSSWKNGAPEKDEEVQAQC
ncbi:MAG: virulence protein [Coriobacteriales bacterium]|jgi:hypothetical protein